LVVIGGVIWDAIYQSGWRSFDVVQCVGTFVGVDEIFNLDAFENLTTVNGKVKITGNLF